AGRMDDLACGVDDLVAAPAVNADHVFSCHHRAVLRCHAREGGHPVNTVFSVIRNTMGTGSPACPGDDSRGAGSASGKSLTMPASLRNVRMRLGMFMMPVHPPGRSLS